MITRKDYLDKTASHADYYRDIINAAFIGPRFNDEFVAVCKFEIENGNTHLNSSEAVDSKNAKLITLGVWDCHATNINSAQINKVMRERGGYPTLGNLVCLAKELMRIQVINA